MNFEDALEATFEVALDFLELLFNIDGLSLNLGSRSVDIDKGEMVLVRQSMDISFFGVFSYLTTVLFCWNILCSFLVNLLTCLSSFLCAYNAFQASFSCLLELLTMGLGSSIFSLLSLSSLVYFLVVEIIPFRSTWLPHVFCHHYCLSARMSDQHHHSNSYHIV